VRIVERVFRVNFGIHKLMELPDDVFEFMLVFIKNRGNIRDMEKELGISYPTVRSRLDTLLALLGFEAKRKKEEIGEILGKLEKGEITAEEAEKKIKEIKIGGMTIMVIALAVCNIDDFKVKSSNQKKPKGATQSMKILS